MAIQIKRGTSAQRKASEVVLEAGQPFLETDTGNLFVGKTGTEKLKDLTLDNSCPSIKTLKELGLFTPPKRRIYGVDLVGSQDPNALVRTDDAVGLNVTVGTSEITSDFDNCYPWSDIEEVTDNLGNVFVKIPKFYSKITKNSDGTYKHQLSGTKHAGFDTLFKVGNRTIDYVMVGKYEGTNAGGESRLRSTAQGHSLTDLITMDRCREYCKANGEGYQQYDFLIDLIIKELWLVEMKTTNCQSIMRGNVQSSPYRPGTTSSVSTPSGSPVSNTDGKHACKYRGIENPWGNMGIWCDGISLTDSGGVYVCKEPSAYESGKTTGEYRQYGNYPSSSGYVKTVAPDSAFTAIQFVTEVGGSDTTYYCDKFQRGGTVLYCSGGNRSSYNDDGLWYWRTNSPDATSNVGGRLCYKPPV